MAKCGACSGSFFEDVKRVGRGALGIAQNALNINQVSDEVYQQRLKQCSECVLLSRERSMPLGVEVGDKDVCQGCGCPVRAKARLDGEICPLNQWEIV